MKTKLFILAALSLSLIFSCKREDVSNCENCQNGSYCKDDTCRCLTGYEGANCETKSSTKFLGDYMVSDSGSFSWTSTCQTGAQFQTFAINRTHMSSIFEDASIGRIIISNYFGDGTAAVAEIKNSDVTVTGQLKITYGTSPNTISTDICFLNNKSLPIGSIVTSTDSIGTDTTGATITGPITKLTISMHGYCYTDLGSCGNEVKETICKSVFTKVE